MAGIEILEKIWDDLKPLWLRSMLAWLLASIVVFGFGIPIYLFWHDKMSPLEINSNSILLGEKLYLELKNPREAPWPKLSSKQKMDFISAAKGADILPKSVEMHFEPEGGK